ncbi:hypothetical protein OC845_006220 [Tilletia horrida]|nr:hypothetical protein OC845_006220 [Tilletia horrida]
MATVNLLSSPYCTVRCLRSVKEDRPDLRDPECPCASAHGTSRTSLAILFHDLQSQLDDPDARNACIQSTGLAGHHGVLFKIRSPNSGHCLVAKGFVAGNALLADHEAAVYTRLQDLQGAPILQRFPKGHPIPSHYEAPLSTIFQQLHQRQVVHGDPELKNVLLDPLTDRLVLVDFERSRLYMNRPACENPSRCRKTRKDRKGRRKNCMYCRELAIARHSLAAPDYVS